jgi:hypothetical protein
VGTPALTLRGLKKSGFREGLPLVLCFGNLIWISLRTLQAFTSPFHHGSILSAIFDALLAPLAF